MACFGETLKRAVAADTDHAKMIQELLVGLGVPFLLSIVAVIGLQFEPSAPRELLLVDVMKLGSLGVLAWHTQAAAKEIPKGNPDEGMCPIPADYGTTKIYRYVALYMYFMAMVLVVHFLALLIPGDLSIADGTPTGTGAFLRQVQTLSSLAHNELVINSITVMSFLYMFAFFYGNWKFIKENGDNLGVDRFSKAFIYGVNIPSIIAFVLVTITLSALSKPDTYLAGAVAFLIYSSTAGAICIDRYARPFLATYGGKCPVTAAE